LLRLFPAADDVRKILGGVRLALGFFANPHGLIFKRICLLISRAAHGVSLILRGIGSRFNGVIRTFRGAILSLAGGFGRTACGRVLAQNSAGVGIGLLTGILAGAIAAGQEDSCDEGDGARGTLHA
jgi:hypothetical protein